MTERRWSLSRLETTGLWSGAVGILMVVAGLARGDAAAPLNGTIFVLAGLVLLGIDALRRRQAAESLRRARLMQALDVLMLAPHGVRSGQHTLEDLAAMAQVEGWR